MANSKEKSVLKKAIITLKALDHTLRQNAITYIRNNPNTPVNKIYSHLKIEQSVMSQHLQILRKIDVVKTKREGKKILYSVNKDKIEGLIKLANQIIS